MKIFNITAFSEKELNSWSKVFYKKGYTYLVESDRSSGDFVCAIQVNVDDDESLQNLTEMFSAYNNSLLKV